jgi:hypothetical protein
MSSGGLDHDGMTAWWPARTTGGAGSPRQLAAAAGIALRAEINDYLS